jgi:hypothetical protein
MVLFFFFFFLWLRFSGEGQVFKCRRFVEEKSVDPRFEAG